MRKARFVAPARHEFLESVRHYEDAEPGLGVRLTGAVEEAGASPMRSSIGRSRAASSSTPSRISHEHPSTGGAAGSEDECLAGIDSALLRYLYRRR